MAAAYKPTCSIAFGDDINAIPTYILIIFAQVRNHDDVLFFLFLLSRCLYEKAESV